MEAIRQEPSRSAELTPPSTRRRDGDLRGRPNRPGPSRAERRLEIDLALNRSAHRLGQVSRSLAPEDGVGSFVEVVEQVLDLWAGVERVVAVVFQVPVAPVQRPLSGGLGVVQPGDRESGPVGPEVIAPGRSAFADGQMSWGDVAFDADLVANVLGDLAGAPALHAGDVELGKSASGHQVMIAAEKPHRAGARSIGFGTATPNASAGVAQPSTRRGRWLSFSATALSSS